MMSKSYSRIANFHLNKRLLCLLLLIKYTKYTKASFNVVCEDLYTVRAAKRPYNNAIISCDLALHSKFVEKRFVIIGFEERKVHEHINILQCKECHRFGHSAKHCNYQKRCTRCAGTHETDECTEENMQQRCFNCMQRNKLDGTKLAIAHRYNDVRCPWRIERINQLKEYIAKN